MLRPGERPRGLSWARSSRYRASAGSTTGTPERPDFPLERVFRHHNVHRARIVAVVDQDDEPREVGESFPTVLVDREAFKVDGYGLRRALEWCAPEENDVTGFIAAHCAHPLFPSFMCGPGAVALRIMRRATVDEHFRRYVRNKAAPPLRAGQTWEYAGRRTYAVQHSEVEDDGVRHTCVVLANASHPEHVGREVYRMENFDEQRWEDDERYRQARR